MASHNHVVDNTHARCDHTGGADIDIVSEYDLAIDAKAVNPLGMVVVTVGPDLRSLAGQGGVVAKNDAAGAVHYVRGGDTADLAEFQERRAVGYRRQGPFDVVSITQKSAFPQPN